MSDETEDFGWAVRTGDMNNVKKVVEAGNFDVNARESGVRGSTPLMQAADFGQGDVITYLIGKGANVNATDNFGNTPLLNAVFEGHTDAVKILLSKGADKNAKGPDGRTALEVAKEEGKEAIVKLLS